MGQLAWTYNARRAAWYYGGNGCTAKAFDSLAWDVRDENDVVIAEGTGIDIDDAKAQALAAFDAVATPVGVVMSDSTDAAITDPGS